MSGLPPHPVNIRGCYFNLIKVAFYLNKITVNSMHKINYLWEVIEIKVVIFSKLFFISRMILN